MLSPQGFRKDGRQAEEARELICELRTPYEVTLTLDGTKVHALAAPSWDLKQSDGKARISGVAPLVQTHTAHTRPSATSATSSGGSAPNSLSGSLPKGKGTGYGSGGASVDPAEASLSSILSTAGGVPAQVSLIWLPFALAERRIKSSNDRQTGAIVQAVQNMLSSVLLPPFLSPWRVQLTVHSASGALLASCLNAAFLALSTAGVPVKEFFTAVSASLVGDTAFIDPVADELTFSDAEMTLGLLTTTRKIVTLKCDSKISPSALRMLMDTASEAALRQSELIKNQLRDQLAAHTIESELLSTRLAAKAANERKSTSTVGT